MSITIQVAESVARASTWPRRAALPPGVRRPCHIGVRTPGGFLRRVLWRAAACLSALGCFLLLSAGGAQAQTQTSAQLVSNLSQVSSHQLRFTNDASQTFTTGPAVAGYKLTAVDLLLTGRARTAAYTVSIWTEAPSERLGTLTNPSLMSGDHVARFSAPAGGIDLEPNADYLVVVDVSTTDDTLIWGTTSKAQDVGGAQGWSIADAGRHRAAGASTWISRPQPVKIGIQGYARRPPPPPATPAAPTLSTPASHTNDLTVTWVASDAGHQITGYDVRYRRKGDTAWSDHEHTGTGVSATITGLLQGARWEAQVRAVNAGGAGAWSDTGAGHTGPARFVSAATTADGRFVEIVFTKEGFDNYGVASAFTVSVNGTSRNKNPAFVGQRTARNIFSVGEFSPAIQAGDAVTVSYAKPSSGDLLTDSDGLAMASFSAQSVTNAVPAVPAAPSEPSVSAVSGTTALAVSWAAPAANASAITDYDLRYYKGSADPTNVADWIKAGDTGGHDHVGTARTATLTGLDANSAYRVQVRATNSAGTGAWSASGGATTGTAVPAAPSAPSVNAVSNTRNLSVSWTAPADGGSAITDYDLRYYAGAADPADEADWVEEREASGLPNPAASTTATVTGLLARTAYRVQVRAANVAGEGAWSASGTATTNASTSTSNRAPVRQMIEARSCVTKTEDTAYTTIMASAGNLVSVQPLVDRSECSIPGGKAPMFFDPDGDTLTFTAKVRDLPDNVFLADGIPNVRAPKTGSSGRVFFRAAAAFEETDVIVDVTATDPHGASVSTHFIARVQTFTADASDVPQFVGRAESRRFAEDQEIEPFMLPAATGGDLRVTVAGTVYEFPHLYKVSGLPAGLKFDPATRTVSGVPTRAGLFDVTYVAEDTDGDRSAADTARQTFTVRVESAGGPKIFRVRIISYPTYDSDDDGTNDTYVRGDTILIDVDFDRNLPPEIRGDGNVRLRLDLGDDDQDLGNSRKVIGPPEVVNSGDSLRFAYTVRRADRDPDGVWVQTRASDNRLLFMPGKATIVHADTGVEANLTLGGLPTTGDPRAKVDGRKTAADTGPRPIRTGDNKPTVNGKTLTVTFDKALDTTLDAADLHALRFDLGVAGAGNYGLDNTWGSNVRQCPYEVEVSNATSTEGGATVTRGKLTLTLGDPALAGNTVLLSYWGSRLKEPDTLDKAGNVVARGRKAPTFEDLAVTNDTAGTGGPNPARATVSGTTLRVVFDGELDGSSTPAGSAFKVETSDADYDQRRIAGTGTATVSGRVVTVTLAAAVRSEEIACLSYVKPASAPLRGAATGNPAVHAFRCFRVRSVSDIVAPRLLGVDIVQTSASPAESKAALSFDEALDATSVPAAGDFAVYQGNSAAPVSAVAVEGRTVVLTLNRLTSAGQRFQVEYTPGTNPIRDLADNAAAAFRQTLPASASGKPALASAVVDGARVTLTWDRPLDPVSVPGPAAFTFNGYRSSHYLADVVAVAGRTAVLRLHRPVQPCGAAVAFTVSYTKPANAKIQGLDGTDADAFERQDVTNARAGWCDPAWLQHAWKGSVILRAKRPFAMDVEPQAAWFTVTASGGPVTVTGAAFSPDDPHELKLTLDREFRPGETVTVSYRRPAGAHGLWDVDGKQLGNIADAPVANDAAVPARLESAETEPRGRGLVLTFTREIAVAGDRRDYTVTVDGERRSTEVASWDGNTVALVLAAPVRWGETVTVAYAKHSGRVLLRDVDRLAVESFGPVAVANTVPQPVNTPATGAPAIAGTARVGETLTASTADIADADGLAAAAFAYQWMSSEGGADADIAGATGASYTLTGADEGKRIKVRVAFTDDAGNAETLTSAATAAVAARPLTASFHGVPAEHDGRRLFSFELRFSDNFPGRLSYKVLRDQALQVTGGHLREAKRTPRGQNRSWEISVRPSSFEDVTVTLPAGSITTESGRTLSGTVEATVRGPALLSVADAEAREGQDAAVSFAVTLSRQASTAVTVDYATADGTATAGEDYAATSGTLTFAVGETRKTVAVAIHDDAIDEGRETFTLTLSNAVGAAILDAEATGTIDNDDPMPRAWTARFGRTVAVHVVDAVQARLDGAPESYIQLGRHRLGGGAPDVQETVRRLAPQRDPGSSQGQALWDEAGAVDPAQTMTLNDLLLGSAFHLVSNAEHQPTGPRLSAWGRVASSGFDGREDEVSLQGTVTTATLGVDGAWKRWLTGLVMAYSEGDGSFSHPGMPGGDLASSLTSVHPYVSYTLSDRVNLWGLAGYGSGALRLDLADRDPMDTDLTMTMGAVGVRGTLLRPSRPGGLELALRSDVLWMSIDSAAAHDLAATEAEASRLRLVLEGSRPLALSGGGRLVPSLQVGLRHDGGDAETGAGLEVGGRLLYASAWGLSIEASVRALVAHEATHYKEWGASGALRFDPGRQGKGFTASLVPSWGMAGSGVERLWGQPTTAGLAPPADALVAAASGRLEAELGYGLAALGGRGLLTPYARVALTEGADQAWHLGTRLVVADGLNLSLEASRRARHGEAAAHDLALLANLGF